MEERAGFVVFYLTFPMTCLWSHWDRVPVAGVGSLAGVGVSVRRLRSRQRHRDGEMKTAAGGGGRGGSLKGPRRGRGTVSEVPSLRLSSSHPGIQAPSLGSLGVVMETGRQARPGEAGGTKGRKEGGRTL